MECGGRGHSHVPHLRHFRAFGFPLVRTLPSLLVIVKVPILA